MRIIILTCTILLFTFISLAGSQSRGLCRLMKESSPSTIPEGEEAVYSIHLLSQPPVGVNVSIYLASLDSRMDITAGRNLLFNSSNWDQRQRFVAFGTNDDDILDSPYVSLLSVRSYSNSANFSTIPGGIFPSGTITILLQDTDRAGADISVEEDSLASIPEGKFSIYNIQLPSIPRSQVVLQLTPVQDTIYLSQQNFIFQPENWNISQAFLVFSVDDDINQGVEFQSNISFTFSSADPYYSNLIVEEFPVLIEDNDEDSVVLTGGINWKQSGNRYETEVTLSLSLDRAYYPAAAEGEIVVLEGAKLDFGDGSSLGPNLELTISHIYPATLLASLTLSRRYEFTCHPDGTPWRIQFSYCCRNKDLVTNQLTLIILESEVNLAEKSSPFVPLLPPFHIKSNSSQLQHLYLPVTASNGHPIQYGLPSSQAYFSSQTGSPPWVQVDTNTGLLTLNTSRVGQAEGLACFLVEAQDAMANLKNIFQLCHYLTSEAVPSPYLLNYNYTNAITAPRLYFSPGETVELELVVISPLDLSIESINPPSNALFYNINPSLYYADLLQFQWTLGSDAKGEYPLCFHSVLSTTYTSLPYCVIIAVLETEDRKVPAIQLIRSLNYTSGYDTQVTLPFPSLSGELDTMEHAFVMLGGRVDEGESLSFEGGNLNTLDVKQLSSSLILITGEDSLSVYSQALASVTYRNEEARPTVGTRYLIVGLYDGANMNNMAFQYTTLVVRILNKPPVLSLSGTDQLYSQRFLSDPIYISQNTLSLSDPDSLGLHNATFILSPLLDTGLETLRSTYVATGAVSLPIVAQELGIDLPFGSSLSGDLHSHITHSLQVNVFTPSTVGDVDVVVYIDHSWLGDIILELEHAGIRRTLVTHPGGALCSADNLFHVVFDQEAEGSLGKTSSSPGVCSFRSQGVYQPEESLTAFSGVNAEGQWTLHVIDNVPASHNGILLGWAVIIQPEEEVFVSTSHSTIPPLLLTRILSPYQSISLNIDSPGRITNLMPRIQISQPFERGLLYLPQLILTHPDGTQVQLSDETYLPCVSGNYTYLVFSDQATLTALSQCVIPANSTTIPDPNITDSKDTLIDLLRPVTSLSSLVGRQSGGEWLLTAWVSRASKLHLIGWSMYIATEPNIDANFNAMTGVLTLTGFDSTENYKSVIGSIQYNNTAPSPTFWILRTVQAAVFDGQTNSASSLTEIVLHHIIIDLDPNDVTSALHPGFSTSFVEHSSAIPIVDPGVLLEDPYLSQGLYNLTFVIEGAHDGTAEFVSVSALGYSSIETESYIDSVEHQYVLTVYSIILSPISLFHTILRSATYSNSADEMTGDNRTLSVSVVEHSTGVPYPSLTATTYIELIHTNDAPILILNQLISNGITNLLRYTEGQGALQLAELSTIVLYDNDHEQLQSITVVITNPKELLHERLVINGSLPNGINYTYSPDTFTLTLYGNASIDSYKIAVSLVSYEHLPHGEPDTTPRLVSFTPYDGVRYGPTTYAYISFSSVNNAPIIRVTETGDDFVTSFREEMGSIPIVSSSAAIFDIDNSTLQYIEIAIANPLDGSDEVLFVSPATVTQTLSNSNLQATTYTPIIVYPNSDNATLVISGLNSLAEYEEVLRTAEYYNLADEPQTDTRDITITISDGLEIAIARTFVMIVLVNDSPRIAEGTAPYLVSMEEDYIGMGFSLLDTEYLFEDDDTGDSKGIGIVSVECFSGTWQLRGALLTCDDSVDNSSVNGTNCAANWLNIPCDLTVANSLLIRFKNDTRLRFLPNLDFNGNASLTVVAWDGTNETADLVFTTAVSSSDIDSFSSAQTTFTVVVLPINDAPVLQATPLYLPSIQEDDFQSGGVTVSSLVTHANDFDVIDISIGIAVIYVDNSNGVWQYKLNTVDSWYNISHATLEWATLLDPNSDIRFVPVLNFHGSSSFSFKAWDQSQGSVPGSNQSTVVSNSYSGPFSINSTTATLAIEPVNDSPILEGEMSIYSITEDVLASGNLGSRVDDVILGHYSDIDSVLEYNTTQMGLSVIWVDNTFGRWQHSCNKTGFSWNYFIGDVQYGLTFPALPNPDKATLLLSHCRIRFLPDRYFNTELDQKNQPRPVTDRPSILVRGWDNTGSTRGRSGTYGNDASYAASSNTNEYSVASQYISLIVTSVNNPPTLHLTNATFQAYFNEFIEDLDAVRVTGNAVELVDPDHDELTSLTVTILAGSSADFLPNSSYCLGIDSRRESILYDLTYTDLNVTTVSLCPYQIVFAPKLSHPSDSVYISQYTRVLSTLMYYNDIEEPSPGVRAIEMVVSDGEDMSLSSYAYISISLVNDAPILDLNIHTADLHSTAQFVEGEGPLLLTNTSNIQLTDSDNTNLTSAVISLIPSPNMQHEVLNATTLGTSIVARYNYTTAALTLDGTDSVVNYERVLASVTYSNTFANPGNPDDTERQVMFVVSDGDKPSRLAVVYVSFQGINNHPYLDVNGDPETLDYNTSFIEEMGPVSVVDPNLSLVDIDSSTLAYVSIRITNPLDGPSEFLTVGNVTMQKTIETNQLDIPKIVEITLLVPNTTFSTVSHELVISGLDYVEEYRQVLLTLQYNNINNEINTQTRTLHFYANDGFLSSPLARTYITLEQINDPPYFISPSVLISPNISEDNFDPNGISIMLLTSGLINDSDSNDPQGIAVIATDIDYGYWQYRLDLSSDWIRIISNVSLYNALLLTADADNYIRFVPNTDFNGNVSMSFLAWDASDGCHDGERRSAAPGQINRIDASFSEASRTLTIEIIPVNDAPVVLLAAEIDLVSIHEDEYTSFGISVPSLATLLEKDVDSSQFGIAVVATDDVNGKWQYTLNNGTSWLIISAVSEINSLVFRGRSEMERIRFVPNLDFNGQSSFSYKLWDLTSSEVSGSSNVNTQTDSITGPFSVNTASARVTVDPVNDSPIISPGLILSPINENMDILSNQGIPVSTIINQLFSDVDVNFKSGLAVVGVDHRNGEFEFSCATSGNAVWELFFGDMAYGVFVPRLPHPTKATLLSDMCRVRFKPNLHFNTEKDLTGAPWTEDIIPYLLVKGWDQTSGTVGDFGVDTTSYPDDITNAFSATTVNVTIVVHSVNLPPVLNLQLSSDSFQTTFSEPTPPLRIVHPSPLVDINSVSITDTDHIHLYSLRVELQNRVDGFSETLLYDLSMTNLNATVHNNDSGSFIVKFSSSDAHSYGLLSYYVMLLKSLRYQNTKEEPTTSPDRTISFLVVDPEFSSTSALATVSIQPVNDPPELHLDYPASINTFVSYEEGQGEFVFLDSNKISLIDHDSLNLSNATITLINPRDGEYEIIRATSTQNINVTYSNHKLQLIGPAPRAEFETALLSVSYEHTNSSPGNPDTSMRTITFSVTDGIASSAPASASIFFSSVNNAPILDLNGNLMGEDYTTYFYEQQGSIPIISPDLDLVDIDNTTLDKIIVRIHQPTGDDFLYVDNVTLYSDNPAIAKTVILTNLRSDQQFNVSRGELVVSGLDYVHEYVTVLKTLRYNNSADETGNFVKVLSVVANDGLLDSNEAFIYINISEVNDPPSINLSIPVIRTSIVEDILDAANIGVSVASIIVPIFNDVDAVSQAGIAITATDTSIGYWEYIMLAGNMSNSSSMPLNATWNRFPTVISSQYALLLRASGELIRIRFVPKQDLNGESSISFVAWDGSDQSTYSGQTLSLTNADPNTGAYSTEVAQMFIDITAVNDAPVIQTVPSLTISILEDEVNSFGISVSDLVSRVTDVDTNNQQDFGLAVVTNDNSNGTWQFTTTGGLTWYDINSTTPSNALLLTSVAHGGYRIRFVPEQNFFGIRELSFVAWDLTSGGDPTTYASTVRSDPITSPFSSAAATLVLTIESVNDSPYFQESIHYLATITEDTVNDGTTVLDIVGSSFRDIDPAYQIGIAVTNIDTTDGKWEWKCATQQNWQDFIGDIVFGVRTPVYPLPLRATLLAAECTIRFLPNLNFNTEKQYITGLPRPSSDIPFISILAWDNTGLTSGRSGSFGIDTTYHNASSTNEFSFFSSVATIDVISVNDPPVLTISGQGAAFSTLFREDGGAVPIVEPAQLFITDADHDTLVSVAIVLERVYDTSYETISLSPNPGVVVGSGNEVLVNTSISTVERLIFSAGEVGNTYRFMLLNPDPQERVSVAAYQTAIRTLVYNNYHSEPTNMTRLMRFYVDDGEDVNSIALTTLFVELIVENIPVLNLGISQVTFVEDFIESLSIVSQNLTLTDVDHNEFFFIASANIFFDQPPESSLEYISISNISSLSCNSTSYSGNVTQLNHCVNPIVSNYDPVEGRITLRGDASLDVYRDTLKTVVYTNRIQEPTDLNKIITFEVFDTNNLRSDPVSVQITITLRNDQPPILSAGNAYRYVEQQPAAAYPIVIGGNITYTDADSGDDKQYSVSVSITNPIDAPYETLSANPASDSITVEYHTLDVLYSITQLVERCVNLTDNSTTSATVNTDRNVSTNTNGSNLNGNTTGNGSSNVVPVPTPATVLKCENVTEVVNRTNSTIVFTGLNLVGPASISEFLEALATVTYANGAEEPNPTERRVTFLASDGFFTSNLPEVTIQVRNTNDIPVVDLNGFMIGTRFMVTYSEGSEAIPIVDPLSMSISDNDHTHLVSATITLTTIYDDQKEFLGINTDGSSLLSYYNSSNGILSVTGNASKETYQSVLRTLTYVNIEGGPGAPNPHMREITVVISDSVDTSLTAYSIVTFLAVNDPPFLDLNGNLPDENATANFVEEGDQVRVFSSDAIIMDIDNGTLASLTISLLNPVDGESESIFIHPDVYSLLSPMGSILTTNHSIVLTNFLSINKYIIALQQIYYINTLDEPSYDTRNVQVIASDGLLTNTLNYIGTITIQPVNDLPQFSFNADPNSNATYDIDYKEDSNSIPVIAVVSPDFSLTDDDDPTLTRIIIERSPSPDGTFEKLFFLSSNPIPGLGHTFVQCPIQSVSNPLTLDISVSLTIEEWRTALSSLTYCNMDPNSFGGVRQIKIVLVDGKGGRSAARYTNINVIAINDPPIFLGSPPSLITDEDNSIQLQVLGNFTDYEETLTGSAIEIVSQPARGSAVVTQPSGAIIYTPEPNDNGVVIFQFRACDSGANCSLPITATVVITPVNDPPTPVGSGMITVPEDVRVQVNLLDYFTDVEDTPATNNTRVVLTPRGGSWEYNMNEEIFYYTPTLHRTGDDSLMFEACDNGGLCINITLTFKITPINDLPFITIEYPNGIVPLIINEDTAVNVSVSIEDVEDNDELDLLVLSVTNGDVRLITLSTQNQDNNIFLQSIFIEYRPNANFYGLDNVTFTATDNENGVTNSTLQISVEYHNDAPTIETTVVPINEDTPLVLTLPAGLGISDSESIITSQQIELLTDPDTVLGTISYNQNTGVLSYTPPSNLNAESIEFSLKVCDTDTRDEIQCSTFEISIIIIAVNDPPIFTPFIFSMREDSSNTTNILPYLSDIEEGEVLPGRISLSTPDPASGVAAYDLNNGDVTYTPNADFFGSDIITLLVCDRAGLCSTVSLPVTVFGVNDAPIADGLRHFSSEDKIDLVNIGTIVRDVDTIENSQDTIDLKISIIETGTNDTTTLVEEGSTTEGGEIRVFQDEGVISYEPPNQFIGYDSFTFAVCDKCDESRNLELGRTTLEDIDCLNQIEENDGLSIDPATGMSIACSIGTIVIVVVNTNDVPVLSDISTVTPMTQTVHIEPFSTQTLFDDASSTVYDEDDRQAAYAISQGFNLSELGLTSSSNIDTQVIQITNRPSGGNVLIAGSDRRYIVYSPVNTFVGYDEFQYEVCDLAQIPTCANAMARVFVSSPGPVIDSLVVSGSVNLPDSKVSGGDTIQISFSEDTNRPPQTGKDSNGRFCGSQVDQIITFDSPFLNSTTFPNAYCAKWDSPSSLTVKIIGRGYPEPDAKIGVWRVRVTQDPSWICSGFDSNHQRYDSSELNTNCLFNADLTSSHSSSVSPPATGDWGTTLPQVTTAIIQNINPTTQRSGPQAIQTDTLIKILLKEPFSSSQLKLYCEMDINEILNSLILHVGTEMELQSCSNLLSDGTNADQVYSESDSSSLSSLGYPMVTELIFRVLGLDIRLQALNSNDLLNEFLSAIRQEPFALVVRDTLNVTIEVLPDAVVELLNGTINAINEQVDVNTPTVESAIAGDPDNFDDVYSDFDVLRITFSVDTNEPPVGSKGDLDKIMVFTPSLGLNYFGTWETSRVLLIIIFDSSRPEVNGTVPTILNLKLEFLPNYLNNQTLDSSSTGIPENKFHCIGDNVCTSSATSITVGICDSTETSCRANTTFSSFSGDFGTAEGVVENPIGVVAGISIAIIIVILILVILIVLLLIYYCYKRVQEKRDRDKALALVLSWKQKQKALSEQKRSSMMGVDESWKSPPTMPLMRGNIDPFSTTAPKMSMESGTFISPTPYEPFQPRAYPSILDSSYPTAGSALPPILLRTPDTSILPPVSPIPLPPVGGTIRPAPGLPPIRAPAVARTQFPMEATKPGPIPGMLLPARLPTIDQTPASLPPLVQPKLKFPERGVRAQKGSDILTTTTTEGTTTETTEGSTESVSGTGSSIPPPKAIGMAMPSRKQGVDPFLPKPLSPIPSIGMRPFESITPTLATPLIPTTPQKPDPKQSDPDDEGPTSDTTE